MSITDSLSVTTEEARKAIMKATRKRRPTFIWGPPGIGKSDMIVAIAKEMGGAVIDLRMAQMEPTDLRGIPFYNKDLVKMDWAEPIDLPTAEFAAQYPVVFLFLDEMNSAPPAVQAAGYQLVLNRRIGKYVLPDNVVIVAAGNRDTDKGVTYRMPTPLANRFIHLEIRPDFTSWFNWAIQNNIHKDVVGYLSYCKADMYDFNPKSASRAFATPRTWVFVSELLEDNDCDEDTLRALIAGTVGEGLSVKFMAHRRVASQLAKPEDILTGKVTTMKTKEISAMYSLVTSLCYELKEHVQNGLHKSDAKEFHQMADNFFRFIMDNFETELIVMGGRVALKNYELPFNATQLKTFDEFRKKYGKYILAAN